MRKEIREPQIGNRFYFDEKDLSGTIKVIKNGWIRIEYDDFSHGDWRRTQFFRKHISLEPEQEN